MKKNNIDTHITIICGSVAKKSHTRAFLKFIEELLKEKGINITFWDLGEKPLPIVIPEYHRNPWDTPNKAVKEFVKLIKNSDGIILGSPLYHGSYSGVLKNALDNLHLDAFRNKPIALVSNGSNIRNCTTPCDHLRLVVRAIYGYALQTQIGTTDGDYEEAEDKYILANIDIKDRCIRLVDELIAFTNVLKDNQINKK